MEIRTGVLGRRIWSWKGGKRSLFRFCERLWHVPPEDRDLIEDSSCFEDYDAVQKEFKQEGGKDFWNGGRRGWT